MLEQRAVLLQRRLRWAGWYAEPRRLQATRSALGAMAAVGSICSKVSCSTTVDELGRPGCVEQLRAHRDAPGLRLGEPVHDGEAT